MVRWCAWSSIIRTGIALLLAAVLVGCMGSGNGSGSNHSNGSNKNEEAEAGVDGGVVLPAIKLPRGSNAASMDMIGLIVYKGKIYTQTATEIDAGYAAELLGEKLGRTKSGINEWSKQDAYAVEFASSIGEADVYAVKGYSPEFRVMTYMERDGEVYAELYECLNGITVKSGADVFGQLGLTGNVTEAHYRTYNDWYYGVESYQMIEDSALISDFTELLSASEPVTRAAAEAELGDYRNDDNYRELALQLKDGTRVTLMVLRGGYIRYSNADVFFKMDAEHFKRLWEVLAGEERLDQQNSSAEQPNSSEEQQLTNDNPQDVQALADMTQFIDLVKAKDAAGVHAFLKRSDFFSWFTLDMASRAIEGLERNFDLASLHAAIDENSNSHSPADRQYGFILVDRDQSADDIDVNSLENQSRAVTLRYEQETGQPIVHTPYVRYYPFAEEMVQTYMNLIAQDQAAELASFMNADDLEVPLWVAEDTITAYRESLDLGNYSIHNDYGFIYSITDTGGNSHTLEVIYGDGLMGIRDVYTPAF